MLFIHQQVYADIQEPALSEELFEEHGSVMLIIDVHTGKINHANKAAADFYGYSVEELESMYIQDINTLSPTEVEIERRAASEEERNHFVFNHRLASGEIKTVEVYSYPIGYPGGQQLFSIIQDVSQRVAAEQELKERTIRYYSILTITLIIQLFIIVLLINAVLGRKRLTEALKAATEATKVIQTGTDLDSAIQQSLEVIGETMKFDRIWINQFARNNRLRKKYEWQNPRLLHPIDSVDEIEEYLLAADLWKRTIQQSMSVWRKVSDLPLEQTGFFEKQDIATIMLVPIVISNKPWGFMVLLDYHLERNISENERSTIETVATGISSAIQLRQQNRELIKLNNLKDDFLKNISHELRTPLSCINMYTEILRSKLDSTSDKAQQTCLSEIEQNVQRLIFEVETLLNLSKISAGKYELSLKNVMGHEIIYQIIELMDPFFKQKDIVLIDKIDKVPGIMMDPRAIKLVLINLLNNMLKFLDSKGQITIQLQFLNHELECKIWDSSPKIKSKKYKRAFNEFHQAPQEGASSIGGTALGLNLCRELVEMHGGQIWIEDSSLEGSVFCFTIPGSYD